MRYFKILIDQLCIRVSAIIWCRVKCELFRSALWIAAIDWIAVSKFEPLLLTRKKGGLMQVGHQLYIRACIPVQWQTNYVV